MPNAAQEVASVFSTDLTLADRRVGKVRDVYSLDAKRLLVIATDRISAFDVVMPSPIAGKGALLTGMSLFWLRFIESKGICRTHLLSDDVELIPDAALRGTTTRDALRGRTMIARKCRVIPIECVVRGYLEGSGWKEYQATGSVCGVALLAGLKQCDKLPSPIFTPATKEEQGKHDENVSFARAAAMVGEALMTRLREMSLAIYNAAAAHALARGIIIADTKFEFGIPMDGSGDEPILIDEALTPDSSRFWPAETYAAGKAQQSYDKQYLREYLESLVAKGAWNKQSPGPELPPEIVKATLAKYQAALSALVG